MDYEYLLSGPRWDILQLLSQGKRTPTELARELKTTLANISQHLRLLELAGLVKKERLKNSEKGKPRLLYSISQDFTFLAAISQNKVKKNFKVLLPQEMAIVNILFLEDEALRKALQKWFFRVESLFNKIKFVALFNKNKNLLVYSLIGHTKILGAAKESGLSSLADIEIINRKENLIETFQRFSDFYIIYDPGHIFDKFMLHNLKKREVKI